MLKQWLLTLTVIAAIWDVSVAEMDDPDMLLRNPVLKNVMARLSALEADDKIQQQRIKELESRDLVQQKTISDLETVVRNQQQQIQEMQTTLAGRDQSDEPPVETPSATDDEITGKVTNDQNEGSSVEDNIDYRIRRQSSEVDAVAFTAILVHRLDDLGFNQNIVFDFVETNIGNAYNPHHGVFIAPIAGTYVFHVTVFAIGNAETWCKIVVNGVNKVDVYARGDASHNDQGSQTLVVRLNQGDDVAIQNGQAHDHVFGDVNTWTTFSGFLLYSDAATNAIIG